MARTVFVFFALAVNQLAFLEHDPVSSSSIMASRIEFTFLDIVKPRQCSVGSPFGLFETQFLPLWRMAYKFHLAATGAWCIFIRAHSGSNNEDLALVVSL